MKTAALRKGDSNYLSFGFCRGADKVSKKTVQDGEKINNADIYFRVNVSDGAICGFGYSKDGKIFKNPERKFMARPGRCVGAKPGLFYT